MTSKDILNYVGQYVSIETESISEEGMLQKSNREGYIELRVYFEDRTMICEIALSSVVRFSVVTEDKKPSLLE